MDHLGGRPNLSFLLLLLQHVVQNGHHPVFEVAVVVVRHQQITGSVDTLETQVATVQIELANVELGHALDEVLLNTSASGDHHIHEVVLHEVVNDLSHSTRHHVTRIGEENGALCLLAEFRIAPLIGLVGKRGIIAQSPVQLQTALVRNSSTNKYGPTILLISSIAADMFVAWKPIVA